jgi:DNA-binding transcriptional LysR family regulator
MNTKNLDMDLLVALDTLLAERNVSRAAKRMHLSQPALSTRLGRLRVLLADPLLLPSRRGMIPTAKALELELPLREALDRLRAMLLQQESFNPMTGRLMVSIAASDYVQSAALIPFVISLRRKAPNVRIALRTIDTGGLTQQLESGDLDWVVMTADAAHSRMRSRKLFAETYQCIARLGHPKVGKRITLKQFCALDHVIVSPRGGGFSGATDIALAALGLRRNVVLSAAHFLFVPEIVAQSDLVALIPSRMIAAKSTVQVFDPPLHVNGFEISLFWHARTESHPGHQWLRDQLAHSLARST